MKLSMIVKPMPLRSSPPVVYSGVRACATSAGRGVEPDDLYQLGCVGFLKAMQGFDEQYGTCFSTYAVPKISGEIRRFLRDDGAVKVSRSIKERAQGIRTARTRLEQTLGREPTLSELAAETGLEPEEIAAAETATGPTESLQKENGETGFTLEHMLGDYDQEERMVEYAALREALRQLPERELRPSGSAALTRQVER